MPGYLHHIEWCVDDAGKVGGVLKDHFGFSLAFHRTFYDTVNPERILVRQDVFRSGEIVFLITENRCEEHELEEIQKRTFHEYPVLTCCSSIEQSSP